MINLSFLTINRKIIRFEIDGPKVIYKDDMWSDGLQIYPKDSKLIIKLRNSRKPALQIMAALILDSNKGKDLDEYQSCNGDENKIAEFIKRDCLNKGLIEVK